MCEITTTSIGGKSWTDNPGGATLLGPAHCTGEARFEKWGSVRMFTPLSWRRSVACPIQVNVVRVRFVFRNSRSVSANGTGVTLVGGFLSRNLVQRHLRKSTNPGSLESSTLRYFFFVVTDFSGSSLKDMFRKRRRAASQVRSSASDMRVTKSLVRIPTESRRMITRPSS